MVVSKSLLTVSDEFGNQLAVPVRDPDYLHSFSLRINQAPDAYRFMSTAWEVLMIMQENLAGHVSISKEGTEIDNALGTDVYLQ